VTLGGTGERSMTTSLSTAAAGTGAGTGPVAAGVDRAVVFLEGGEVARGTEGGW
jgi:hypothetical protein